MIALSGLLYLVSGIDSAVSTHFTRPRHELGHGTYDSFEQMLKTNIFGMDIIEIGNSHICKEKLLT